jgi:excisionase family DNA binding protein
MDRLLTVEQLAIILQVSIATIYKWVWAKQIPYIKLSRRALRFEESKIKEWIEKKTYKGGDANEQNIRKNRKRKMVRMTPCNGIGNLIEKAKREVLDN